MIWRASRVLLAAGAFLLPCRAEAVFFVCERADGVEVPCRVWLVPADRESAPVQIASGRRHPTAAGKYFVRAESPDGVLTAPAAVVVTEDRDGGEEARPDRLHLRPGARLEVPRAILGDTGAVHLLSLENGSIETLFLAQRRFSLARAGRAIVVGLAGPNRVAGVTRPFAVPAGGVVETPPFSMPSGASGHVILSWQFPAGDEAPTDDLCPLLRRGEETLKPAETHFDRDRLRWAVFYDVPQGEWSSLVVSRLWRANPSSVHVEAGRTTFLDPVALKRRPALSLRLDRAGELAGKPFAVTVYRVGEAECEPARIEARLLPDLKGDGAESEAERSGVSDVARVEHLDPGCFVSAFECEGRRTHVVSLLREEDAQVTGRLVPIRITGTLRWSGEDGPGFLRFTHLNDGAVEDEVEAATDGTFRASLWQPGYFSVRITPTDGGPAATKRLHIPAGTEVEEVGFDVPAGTFRYRVVDAASAEPVPAAALCCLPGLEGDLNRAEADEEGRIRFRLAAPTASAAPGPPRRLSFRVSAEGYEPEDVEITSLEPPAAESTVRLQKRDEETEFTALLPDGSAAGAAMVFLSPPGVPADDVARSQSSRCDQMGVCPLASTFSAGQPVAVVHPRAGVTMATVGELRRTGVLQLLPAAGGLDLRLSRGAESLQKVLSVVVVLRGLEVPVAALQTANLLAGAVGVAGAQRDAGGNPDALLRTSLLPPGAARVFVLARTRGASGPVEVAMTPVEVWIPHDRMLEASLP